MEAIKERKPNIVWEVFDSNFQIRIIAKTYVYIEIFGDINKLNQILHSFKAIIEELEEIEKRGIGILSSQRIKEIIDSVSKSLENKS